MNRASLAAIAALGLGLGMTTAHTAHAQPAPANPNASAADAALAEGRRLYDLQEWDKAIAKFKEAYTLRDDAAALFNIAQSYRLKGDCTNAVSFYKTFKRKFPNEKAAEKVDKFIADMDACAKTQPATPPTTTITPPTITTTTTPDKPPTITPPPTTSTPPPATITPPPTAITPPTTTTTPSSAIPPSAEKASHGNGTRTASYVLFGVGGAGVISGVVFGVLAHRKANDAENPSGAMPTWDPSIQNAGRRDNKIAIASFAVGGAAIVGGAVLFVLSGKRSSESSAMTFVPADGGGTMVYGGRF